MQFDNFDLNRDKLADPDHYPDDKSTDSPAWYSNIVFPITSEELIFQFGNEKTKDKNGEEKTLKEILSNYPDREFKSLQDLSETALGDITEQKYKGTDSGKSPQLGD